MRKLFSRMLCMATLLSVALFFGGCGTANQKIPDSYYQNVNIENGGEVCYGDGRIFYVGPYDETDTKDGLPHNSLYSTDYTGDDKQLLTSREGIGTIRYYDGYVYYSAPDLDEHMFRIIRISTDAQTEETVVQMEFTKSEGSGRFCINNEKIYYMYDSDIFACGLDGSNPEKILDAVNYFMVQEDVVYAAKSGEIEIFDLNSKSEQGTVATEGIASNLLVIRNCAKITLHISGIITVPFVA